MSKKSISVTLLLSSLLCASMTPLAANGTDGDGIDFTESTAAEAPAFTDIEGHWAEDIITKYKDSGIVEGYPDGTFRPDEYITRAELAKIIVLTFGLEGETLYTFTDVDSEEWYYPYVRAAGDYIPCLSATSVRGGVYPSDTYGKLDYSSELYCSDEVYTDNFTGEFLPNAPVMRHHAAETAVLMNGILDGVDYRQYVAMHYEMRDNGEFIGDKFKNSAIYKDDAYNDCAILVYDPHGRLLFGNLRLLMYAYLANEQGLMLGDPDGYFRPGDGLTRAEILVVLDRILETDE